MDLCPWRALSCAVARAGAAAMMLALLASHPVLAQTFTLTLQPNTIPSGTQNQPYSQTITAVGGNAPYTCAVTSGSLPAGITLSSGGLLSGTATVPNNYNFTITATDVDNNTGFRPYTFSVGTQGGLSLSPATLPNGTQNVAYSQSVTASGGSGGYTVDIGTASLTVNPTSLPNGTQGVAYNHSVSASGGTGPYTFALTSGSLPAGLSLNTGTGAITGTPTGTGPSTFTIQATDSLNDTGSRTYTINIGTNSLSVNPASLPAGTQGSAYSQTLTASGGSAPYTFAVTAGSLPSGLSLGSGGAITGTPSASGTFNFTVQATDTTANTGSRAYSLTINLVPLTLNPATLPAGTQGTPYSQSVTASGGSAPYSYAIISGGLPPGLALNTNSGAITGTPTTGGSYTFTVQATDTTPNTGSRTYTVNIGTNSLTVNPASLPT